MGNSDFAAMLDEMMGPERNVALDQRTGKTRHFTDPNVDKLFVAGCSPYHLFRGSAKNEGYLREVEKYSTLVCDESLKAQYDALPQEEKDELGYEYEMFNLLEELIAKCDVRIRRAREQIGETSKKIDDKVAERRAGWQSRIDLKMKASEEAGEAGDVDNCQAHLAAAEKLRAEMEKDLDSFRREQTRFEGSQKVCTVSGAIISHDASPENDGNAHFTGRNFVGWKKIREVHAAIKARGGVRPPARDGRPRERERHWPRNRDHERDRHRESDRGHRRSRSRSPDRARDRNRSRDRDRDRERGRDRDRSRDRDRHRHRSRSRDIRDRDDRNRREGRYDERRRR